MFLHYLLIISYFSFTLIACSPALWPEVQNIASQLKRTCKACVMLSGAVVKAVLKMFVW